MTTTIIFGNGIGMAVDSVHFDLQRGLENAWNEFNDIEKTILSIGRNRQPILESDLEKHQSIMSTCRYLKNVQGEWLAEDGKKFSDLYQNYVYKVAKHFFEYDKTLPPEFDKFIDNLSKFIRSHFNNGERCHVVTLNYDRLLYNALIEKNFLDGYQNGGLVDGIHNNTKGFSSENLIRTNHNFGWYLHLHGSPVFRTDYNGTIDKCNINDLPDYYEFEDKIHDCIVLGHAGIKKGIINDSILLNSYFNFFINALSESNKVIIIGYSGLDEHINFQIKNWVSTSPKNLIEIIEWNYSGKIMKDKMANERNSFWKDKLYRHIQITWYENILHYDFMQSEE